MKQLKLTVYFILNDESFTRTRMLTKRVGEEMPPMKEVKEYAEHVVTAEMAFQHGPKTTVTVRNIRAQVIEEVY